MDQIATPGRTPRPTRTWRVLAALLSVLALTLGAGGWARLRSSQHEPASITSASGNAAAVPSARTPELTPAARPLRLEISTIDVSARIAPMGLNPDHTVEVPRHPDNVGWYRLGSPPGQPGSAVLLGHVDSTRGPAVFYRLRSLTPGDEVAVTSSDGSVSRFEVRTIATYPNDQFPARKVYRTAGRPGLALVTCGGRYDAARGGYQANVVVFADLVSNTSGLD